MADERLIEQVLPIHPDEAEQDLHQPAPPAPVVDLQQGFRTRFPGICAIPRLAGPATGPGASGQRRRVHWPCSSSARWCKVIIPATVMAGVLMLVFEMAVIYKLWLSTRDFSLAMAEAEAARVAA